MALLPILRYPDPRLHTVAKPVKEVDDRIRQLADDMLETMRASDGVGLAATQVDVHERVIVMDTSETHDQPQVLINPEIIERSAGDDSARPLSGVRLGISDDRGHGDHGGKHGYERGHKGRRKSVFSELFD